MKKLQTTSLVGNATRWHKILCVNSGGIQGKNDFDKIGLKQGATRQEVLKAMEGHVIAKAELDGKYPSSSLPPKS